MNPPCKDCITLGLCRARVKPSGILFIECSLIDRFIDPPDGVFMHREGVERPMYRRTRINEVRQALGLKKQRKSKAYRGKDAK